MAQRTGLGLSRDAPLLLLVFALALVLFVDQASLQLGPDDLSWLQGKPPLDFDLYRQVPLVTFATLDVLFGPSAVAALALMFALHCLNTLFVFQLGKKLLGDRVAALVAAAVFAINPITLSTLTWISCLSYAQGTVFALAALLAFWRACDEHGKRPILWAAIALLCFGAGLFCSHTLLFLPVLFLVWGWFRGQIRLGAVLLCVGMALAALINVFVYSFGQYGLEASRLFGPDFALAYASTGLASGLALALAYPLSFFVPTVQFLRICFAEPLRWGMTILLLAIAILANRTSKDWRLALVLALSFLALIAPYVIRLYLTPETINFDIAYVLSGRVFYLPMVVVALALGKIVSRLYQPLRGRAWAWLLLLFPLGAYAYALWALDRKSTLAWEVVLGDASQSVSPRWNPYAVQEPLWFVFSVGILLLLALVQIVVVKRSARCRTT